MKSPARDGDSDARVRANGSGSLDGAFGFVACGVSVTNVRLLRTADNGTEIGAFVPQSPWGAALCLYARHARSVTL